MGRLPDSLRKGAVAHESFFCFRNTSIFEIAELPEPTPGPGEVLVCVAACGICGSDVHGYDGSSGRRIPPIVMGHEAAGRIAAVGFRCERIRGR